MASCQHLPETDRLPDSLELIQLSGTVVYMLMEDLCTFEADVKGVMFYSGRKHLDPSMFSHV